MNKIVLIKLREKKKYNQSTTLTLQQLVALNKSMRQNFKERKKKKSCMRNQMNLLRDEQDLKIMSLCNLYI